MRFEFVKELSEPDMTAMVVLLNQVAARETTMGYHEILSPTAGRELTCGIDEEIRQGTSHLLVARNDSDTIVGTITLTPQKLPARKHVVEMKRCVIHEDYRGTMLLDGLRAVLEKTDELGCDVVVIDVRSDGRKSSGDGSVSKSSAGWRTTPGSAARSYPASTCTPPPRGSERPLAWLADSTRPPARPADSPSRYR